MSRTRIKICGVCDPGDADDAVRAGVDAIGMIRVESAARYIDMDTARAIVEQLPAFVTPVVVYMDTSAEVILQELKLLGRPAAVQLNGEESPEFIQFLLHVPVIKAVRVDDGAAARLRTLRDTKLPNLVGIVLESPGQMGGSGVGNDWDRVERLLRSETFSLPMIAAGGLTPENVGAVVRRIHPHGVDVSSGVEEKKRAKSIDKIRDFVATVRAADQDRFDAYKKHREQDHR